MMTDNDGTSLGLLQERVADKVDFLQEKVDFLSRRKWTFSGEKWTFSPGEGLFVMCGVISGKIRAATLRHMDTVRYLWIIGEILNNGQGLRFIWEELSF